MSNRPNTRKSRATPPRPSATKQSGLSRGVVIGAVALAVVLIAVIAIAVSVGGDDDEVDAGPQTFPVEITGAALPDYPRGGDDPGIGAAAPTVTGSTFDGQSVTIADDGTPKVVLFLAHWCPHCRAEVPRITDWLSDNGAPDGVDLYAVSTGVQPEGAPNYPPSRWLEREEWPVPTIADDEQSSAASAFGLTAYPYFVAIDGDGNVVERASGELTMEQFAALIDTARQG